MGLNKNCVTGLHSTSPTISSKTAAPGGAAFCWQAAWGGSSASPRGPGSPASPGGPGFF